MSAKTFEAERIHFLSGVLVAVTVIFAYAPYYYGMFLHDVTAAILVSQNNKTAAMLVSQTSPVRVEHFSYANAFFCSNIFKFA